MAIKNIGELGLDEITEDYLMAECEDMGAELGVDTHQGSVYMDACSGHIIRTAKFFNDLRTVNEILSILTCTGDVLTEKLMERGLERNPPADTAATYYVEYVGAEPQVGDLMSCDDHFFTTQKLNDRWVIVSEETGTDMNTLVPGLPVIPDQDVDNLISATLKELAVPAVDMEEDDSARSRYIDKLSGPAENGNKVQIRSWCEEIQGVGAYKNRSTVEWRLYRFSELSFPQRERSRQKAWLSWCRIPLIPAHRASEKGKRHSDVSSLRLQQRNRKSV